MIGRTIINNMEKRMEEIEIRKRIETVQTFGTAEISKTTEDLRRLVVNQTSMKTTFTTIIGCYMGFGRYIV